MGKTCFIGTGVGRKCFIGIGVGRKCSIEDWGG